jgi:RNA polymerase sigma-70 factor (ECF subfamily)
MKADHTHISHMNDSNTDIWSISETDFKKLFEDIYYEHIDSLYRYAHFRLGEAEKATDLVQDVFIKYFAYMQKLRKGEKKGDLNHRAILFQSLRNTLIDHYRTRKSYSLDAMIDDEGYDDLIVSEEDISVPTETDINFKKLTPYIVKLKPEQQELLYMRYFEGLSISEISIALSERENTISVKLHRILEVLRKSMEKSMRS